MKRPAPLPRSDALKRFLVGTTVQEDFRRTNVKGQAHDYGSRFWRVRYEDGDWKELS